MSVLTKNPFLSTFLVCLLLFLTAGTFFGNHYINSYIVQYFEIVFLFVFIEKDTNKRLVFTILSLFFTLLYLAFNIDFPILFLFEILLLVFFTINNHKQLHCFTITIVFGAFLLHLFYILQTKVDIRQHDLDGIILYMHKISENIINWQNFDPWYMYYLFHQPLHFIMANYVVLAEIYMWGLNNFTLEGLQYLSLFYVTSTTILVAYIFKELKIRGIIFYSLLLLFAFNPTLTIFSGYISGDTPVLFWSYLTIYFAILWYKHLRLKYVIFAGLALAFGTLTKLSILSLVPALSFLFLHKLFVSKNKKDIILQLSFFIIITVPLALSWIIRNHILFDMQFFNIPDTSPFGQNFRDLTLWDRLFNFSNISEPFIDAPLIVDHNLFLALIKTELFGEWNLSKINSNIYFPAVVLYILNIIIKIMAVISLFYSLIKYKSTIKKPIVAFFIIIFVTNWLYVIKYALDYPYVCSTDYRLFTQLIISELVIIGQLNNLKIKQLMFATSIVYAILSVIIYCLILI